MYARASCRLPFRALSSAISQARVPQSTHLITKSAANPPSSGATPNRRNMSGSSGGSDAEGQAAAKSASSSSKPAKGPRPSLTHFLALPLHGQHYDILPDAYSAFKTAIKQFAIDETDAEGTEESIIPKDAIREFNTLHLTLGVMSLSPEELKSAKEALAALNVKELLANSSPTGKVTADEKLFVDLKGVESMSNKPSDIKRTGVLYIPPTDSKNRLYPFSLALRDHFIKAGFIEPENRPLKLHATIVNTVYAKPPKSSSKKAGKGRGGGGGGGGRSSRITFDATEVLEKYNGHIFGENLEIDRVQICKMGAKKGEEVVLEDGTVDIVGGGYEVVSTKLIWD